MRAVRVQHSLFFVLDLLEEFFDADSLLNGFIVIKRQFGNPSQMMQPFAELAPDETCG